MAVTAVSGSVGSMSWSHASPIVRQSGLQLRIGAPGDKTLSHEVSMTPPDKAGQSYKISPSCAVFLMTSPMVERWSSP